MSVSNFDLGTVVNILAQSRHRVRYGVLGAAIATRVGHPAALPGNYGNATVTMLNSFFGGRCPAASWVVSEDGFPEGYGNPPGPLYDADWNVNTPLHDDVQEFLDWLDANAHGWDANLQSKYP